MTRADAQFAIPFDKYSSADEFKVLNGVAAPDQLSKVQLHQSACTTTLGLLAAEHHIPQSTPASTILYSERILCISKWRQPN